MNQTDSELHRYEDIAFVVLSPEKKVINQILRSMDPFHLNLLRKLIQKPIQPICLLYFYNYVLEATFHHFLLNFSADR